MWLNSPLHRVGHEFSRHTPLYLLLPNLVSCPLPNTREYRSNNQLVISWIRDKRGAQQNSRDNKLGHYCGDMVAASR